MTEPTLTRAEEEVVECLAKGWSYGRIAAYLGIKKGTVYVLAGRVAAKLPNPDDIKPYQLVYAWASKRLWREQAQLEHQMRETAQRRAWGFLPTGTDRT